MIESKLLTKKTFVPHIDSSKLNLKRFFTSNLFLQNFGSLKGATLAILDYFIRALKILSINLKCNVNKLCLANILLNKIIAN